MTRLVSVDPGVHFCGVAEWEDGKLVWAGLVHTNDLRTLERIDTVVVEKPQKDRRTLRIRMQDFINLSVAAGLAAGSLVSENGKIIFYTPAEWKKSLPKDVSHDRLQTALHAYELARIDLPKNKKGRTDTLDAVALGLAHLHKTGVRVGKCFTVQK